MPSEENTSNSPTQWFYTRHGTQHGPVAESELQRLAQSGSLTPEDLVWNSLIGDRWVSASTIEHLFSTAQQSTLSPQLSVERGMTQNLDLMFRARESLKGRWGLAVGATLIYTGIVAVFVLMQVIPQGVAAYHAAIATAHAQQLAGMHHMTPRIEIPERIRFIGYGSQFLQFVITAPLMVGFFGFFLTIARRSEASLSNLFQGFNIFWKALLTYFLMILFILLWTLLLIIPGIMAGYSYSMTFFILADDPSVSPLDALQRSKEMMKGRRGKLFFLQLRFIGWFLLALLTCGISSFWVAPYYQTALAHFYDDVRPVEAE